MKRILYLSEEEARTTLYCAGLDGKHAFYVTGNLARNQTIQFHPHCKKFIDLKHPFVFDENSPALIEELLGIVRAESIDILFPASITGFKLLEKHREQLEQAVLLGPFPSRESIDVLDHKYDFYLFCQEHGIPHPASVYRTASSDIDPASPGVNYPLLIKPVLGAGGFKTLVFLRHEGEMQAFLERPEAERDSYFPALLQEFFEGQDIDFNALSRDGKVLASSVMKTDYYEKNPELSFTYFLKNDAVTAYGEKILQATRYTGPTNMDMRIRQSDGELMLIEVNPRYWDRVNASLMDGMNFLDLAIRSTLGETVSAQSRCSSRRWVSSLSLLLKTIVKDVKPRYLKYLILMSPAQIRFIRYLRKFMQRARQRLSEVEAH